MIKYSEKCSGCGACRMICPQEAIELIKDEGEFEYPKIDVKKCIGCGLCEKACPIDKKIGSGVPIKTYAFKHINDAVRKKSASGGFFSALSEMILGENGCVYGVIYNRKLEAKFVRATTKEMRNRMRDSKYVQADLGDIYKYVEQDLTREVEPILFVGTPCQVAGLKRYLMMRRVDMSKLILVDLLCYGVGAPKLFEEYIKFCQKKRKKKIVNYYHRKKIEPWGKYSEGIVYEDGTLEKNSALVQIWKNLYMSGLMLRKSCYHCKYTTLKREGDISIGDFWNGGTEIQDLTDGLGVSIVLINTQKGQEVFSKIKCGNMKECKTKPYQACMKRAAKFPVDRERFWLEYEKRGFSYIALKYGKYNLKDALYFYKQREKK